MFKFKKKDTITFGRRRLGGDTVAPKTTNVFSYRASRSTVSDNLGRGEKKPVSPVESRKGRRWLKRTKRTMLVLIFLAFVVFNLWVSREPTVVMLGVTGESRPTYRDPKVYQLAAEKAFSNSIFNTNKITVNKASIEDSLRQSFPELAKVTVTLPVLGNRPTVYVQPSTSRLILTTTTGQALVLDVAGKAVATGQVVKSLREAGLPEVQDKSVLDTKVGDTVLPSTSVAFITEVARQLKAKGIEITGMTLPGANSELHLRIKGAGYYVKFNMRGDARVEAGSFLALKKYLEAQQKAPAEYIDVRIETRAYYK